MMYTDDVREKCARLYKRGLSIKEIMQMTGLKSSRTVYKILKENDIPLNKEEGKKNISVTLDKETLRIIEREKPRNVSRFICRAVKKSYSGNI